MPDAAVYPDTGWEISYDGFLGLLRSADASVRRFLETHYGYSIVGEGRRPRILNAKREVLDPAWVHEMVQEDPSLQREIYGIAMSLWR
jgi:hypothetical protein